MATLMLGTIYEETREKYQLRLLAGAEGLYRSLRWLYFSEDIGNADFLRGGELMVITGFGLQGQETLEGFLRMLMQKNCCGVIINVGKYIVEEDISDEMRRLCDENRFPLITMPWKFHLADIIQEYSRRIFFRTHEQDRLYDLFGLLLTDHRLCAAEDEARLAAHQFDPEGDYCVARLSWKNEGKARPAQSLAHDLHVLTENHLNREKLHSCAFLYQDGLVLIFHGVHDSMVAAQVEQICQLCQASFPGLRLCAGIGSTLPGFAQLRESESRAALAMARARLQGTRYLRFSDLGIFQLFFICRDASVLRQYLSILDPLVQYDAQYDSQLVETLRLYLQFGGSVQLVSDELYCHRNTTNYRIKKIKALLHADLDEREVIFQLQLAFHLREYEAMQRDQGK